MKYKSIFLALILMTVLPSHAQEVGKLKLSDYSYGLGKLKNAQRVYIAYFNVNFEHYKESVDYKQGGSSFGNTSRGDATARAALGLSGIEDADVLAATNKLHKEFVAELQSYGLEIISTEEAKGTAAMANWQLAQGPYVIDSEVPGLKVAAPDSSFLYGKGNQFPKLSKELGDAMIVGVNLYAMFSEDKADLFKGRAAKVKILMDYRLVGNYVVSVPKTKGLRLKGSTKGYKIGSSIDIVWSKLRVGAGALAQYNGTLKKPLAITGVIKKEKVVAYQKQGSSTSTSFSQRSYIDTSDRFSKTAKWVPVDSTKYSQGLYKAGDVFIKGHLAKAFKKLKKTAPASKE